MTEMKLRIQEIDLEGITKEHANELMNEINKATDGKLYFTQDFPRLKEIYELLNSCFRSSIVNVHRIDKREQCEGNWFYYLQIVKLSTFGIKI